jgi:hypothetical protein
MRRRHGDRRRETPGRRVQHPDLFAPPRTASGAGAAVWRALPEGARRTLTGLLARLLLEHGADARRAGGRHDP